jgi:2-polyprenyl-3-methyl-5-hydroxy-6-metoxy-1,4-benzoquinol methylase
MNSYQETHKTWNTVASAYEASFMDLDLYNDTYNLFLDLLAQTNATILDVGCGPGNISKHLVAQNPEILIYGVDVSLEMIQRAKGHVPSGNFQVLDIRNLATLKQTFQGVICGFCLPYLSLKDCSIFIKTCHNKLTSEGIVYLSFVEGTVSQSGFISGSSGDRVYFYYHTLDAIKEGLERYQLSVTHTLYKKYTKKDGSEEMHTIVIAKKS